MENNRVQLQLDKHSNQIAKLFSKIDDTNDKIQKIFNMLNQIRYFIYGGFAYFLASEVGMFNLLRQIGSRAYPKERGSYLLISIATHEK